MPLLLTLLKSYWKQIGLSVLLCVVGYLAYNHVYQSGYDKASAKYELVIKDYNDKLAERITHIESDSHALVAKADEHTVLLGKDMNAIVSLAKKTPYFIVKDGKCDVAPEFVDSYNAVIRRANSK